MREAVRKTTAGATILAMLGLTAPQPAIALGKDDWIPPGSCAAEVAAFNAANPYAPPYQNAQFYLETAWSYKYGAAGEYLSPEAMLRAAQDAEARAASEPRAGLRTQDQLVACSYRVAAANTTAYIQRIAPGGLPAVVSTNDCVAEQRAFAAAYEERVREGLSSRGPVVAQMLQGWAFNMMMNNRGAGTSADDMRVLAKRPTGDPTNYTMTAYTLSACLYEVSLQRYPNGFTAALLGGGSVATTPAGPVAPSETCVGDKLAAMNRKISDADQRLDWFMTDSPYAKIEGQKAATPMLVVTMWGLQQQITAIKANCPDSEKFKGHLEDLEASFKSAKTACEQIRSGGGECEAVEPEKAS